MTTEAYYRHLGGDTYESTIHAQGAWQPQEQHMAPASGILAHVLEQCSPREDMRMARISYDILGMIHGGEFTATAKVIRPGKTIELLEAEMVANGRTAIRATAWRLKTEDTSAVAAVEDHSMPGPDEAKIWTGMSEWPGGYIASLDLRVVEGHRPGRGQVWVHSPYDMVEGVTTSNLVQLIGLVDTANGIASRVRPGAGSYMFPNVDLQIHLHRNPRGRWLGLDNRVTFGEDGIGLTSTILHDADGPFGRSEQLLTIRKT